jgi:hypothetical protein
MANSNWVSCGMTQRSNIDVTRDRAMTSEARHRIWVASPCGAGHRPPAASV